jgi:hypothetical protein
MKATELKKLISELEAKIKSGEAQERHVMPDIMIARQKLRDMEESKRQTKRKIKMSKG